MNHLPKLAFILLLLASACATETEPDKQADCRLHSLFGSDMVLQRDQPIRFFGTATPGSTVAVDFNDNTREVTADPEGNWEATFDPLPAGGPYTAQIRNYEDVLSLSNILMGDVWICSGQSNMEWPLHDTETGPQELENMNYDRIRMFRLKRSTAFQPLDDLAPGDPSDWTNHQWMIANDDSVNYFSAVGYFFAKEIQQEVDVPIGLIGTYWGGTEVEAWTSIGRFDGMDDFADEYGPISKGEITKEGYLAEQREKFDAWRAEHMDKGVGLDEEWYRPETDVSDWRPLQVPGLWDGQYEDMASFDGAGWLRTTFDLPEAWLTDSLKITFGQVDDHDAVWLNGEYVGETLGYQNWSSYTVPPGLLKATGNVLVVRVYDHLYGGGFYGFPEHLNCHPVSDNSAPQSLAGEWLLKKGAVMDPNFPPPNFDQELAPNDHITVLFNAMISPLLRFPIKGAIWYQGETNGERGYQYRTLFPNMIEDWREHWGQGDFPFYYVQLANFMERRDEPVMEGWPELREAQLMTLDLPNTGMAVIIDIGEADDIHPRNKRDVGKRLALNALAGAYEKNVVPCGPIYTSHEVQDGAIHLSFEHGGGGLQSTTGEQLQGFAVAGEDQVFHWADARIEGEQVIVSSPQVPEPVAVRYAWANNPAVSLYNAEGLPATPFRTDSWRGLSEEGDD